MAIRTISAQAGNVHALALAERLEVAQQRIEANDKVDFDTYLADYFAG